MFGHVFKAAMGAEAVLSVLERLDLDALRTRLKGELAAASGQRRKKATKRLNVVEALINSNNQPEWMVFEVLPVLPPELRPMVQLDGGRFATSDLNDLYRRVINRNNRLKRLLSLGAPEIIIRNEKRMLQEAVDSLVDNGRRGRAVNGSGNHKLKSLSDMLKGKQGRFRQNLLGKRVDYSGRSVIVVGPELKLHQCGLPKKMALELFKPFVMHSLVAKGLSHNIKSAKRIVERARPEVWDVLDEVIRDRPVLLNRAPTLHRLGIQAFQPVLIEGSAVQLHPLVCAAFNADFDGDQMAVHVPLSREAVAEAKQILLSTKNLLSPASGDPTVTPTLDMVLGSYYMTEIDERARGAFAEANGAAARGVYASFEEAKLAFDLGTVDLRAPIKVRTDRAASDGSESDDAAAPPVAPEAPRLLETSIGRLIFNEALPGDLPYQNYTMDRPALRRLVALVYRELGSDATAEIVDRIKDVGFRYATQSGVTIAIHEIVVPHHKKTLIAEADGQVADLEEQYLMGLITEEERYQGAVEVWSDTTRRIENDIAESLAEYGSLNYMASSGTKGNITQIRQMAGMRGLMADPHGQIIQEPIRASFREGLTVLEYFISTHGARKGLADTALRTADSGYLTRRLIDVSQDVIIGERDCETTTGLWSEERETMEDFRDRIVGRYAAAPVADETTGEVIVGRNEEIDEAVAERLEALAVARVYVRTPMSCEAERGICQLCYGRDLARGELVRPRTAVGIIAAQSIGEPGTQLTMRTFHTGGVAGATDITSGLPRVEELFEARAPKGEAIISEIDGVVEVLEDGVQRLVRVSNVETLVEEYEIPVGSRAQVADGDHVVAGSILTATPDQEKRLSRKDAKERARVLDLAHEALSDPEKRRIYDAFLTLGVDRKATKEVIKSAWRAKLEDERPDASEDREAAERVARIDRARDVLADPARRAVYDALLALDVRKASLDAIKRGYRAKMKEVSDGSVDGNAEERSRELNHARDLLNLKANTPLRAPFMRGPHLPDLEGQSYYETLGVEPDASVAVIEGAHAEKRKEAGPTGPAAELDASYDALRTAERRTCLAWGASLEGETHYDVLGIDLTASAEAVERAYEKQAKELAAATDETDVVPGTVSRIPGVVRLKGRKRIQVVFEDREDREYAIPAAARLLVGSGETIDAGAQITEGAKNPQHILSIQGRDAVRRYMVDEVQKVYRSQGVNINDKHIEVITRQMLRRVSVDHPGDTGLLPGELIARREFEEIVAGVVAEGGEPATAQPVLLGVTKASLNTDSWLAAASFQETTRVLTNAAVEGKIDKLAGLKENVIIGKLIPARAEIEVPRREFVPELDLPESLELDEEPELARMFAEREAGAAAAVAVDGGAFPPPLPNDDAPVEDAAFDSGE